VNDTYTAQNLVNINNNSAPLHQLTVFQGHLFRDSESYGSLIPERAVSLSRRNSFKHLSISKAVGPFDMTNIGGGISWKEI
jgi:hypothetical protein